MCFGSNNSTPAAPVATPAVPVDQITAGHPTVTVTPNPATNPNPNEARTPPAAQTQGPNTGINM